jgi:hypothetical protein
MTNNGLTKLVDNLKNKIKKMENQFKIKREEIQTYRIFSPIIKSSSKKYIGLLFSNNYDSSEEITNSENCFNFIKLKKNNNIINYSITLKINDNIKDKNNICSFSLGIRDKNEKIKIIKGSKIQCNTLKDSIEDTIIINNTTIYEALDNQELCLIADLTKNCNVVNKKSIIKILNL